MPKIDLGPGAPESTLEPPKVDFWRPQIEFRAPKIYFGALKFFFGHQQSNSKIDFTAKINLGAKKTILGTPKIDFGGAKFFLNAKPGFWHPAARNQFAAPELIFGGRFLGPHSTRGQRYHLSSYNFFFAKGIWVRKINWGSEKSNWVCRKSFGGKK